MNHPDRRFWWGPFPGRDIHNQIDGSLYLRRIYLLPFVYLHLIAQADADRHLHNHPWKWARSLILTGGYLEQRGASGSRFFGHWRRPWSWVRLNGNTYHRIALVERNTWTLFIAGPRVKSWGFWVRGMHVDFQRYFSLFQR